MKYVVKFKKGDSYNSSKIEQAICSITDDDLNFKEDYELSLEINK